MIVRHLSVARFMQSAQTASSHAPVSPTASPADGRNDPNSEAPPASSTGNPAGTPAPPPTTPNNSQQQPPSKLYQTVFTEEVWKEQAEAAMMFMDIRAVTGASIAAKVRERDPSIRITVIIDHERHTACIKGPSDSLVKLANLWYRAPVFSEAILVPSLSLNRIAFPRPFHHRPLLSVPSVSSDTFNECRRLVEQAATPVDVALGAPGKILWCKRLGKQDSSKKITMLIAPACASSFEICLDQGIDLPDGNHYMCYPYVDRHEIAAYLPNGPPHPPYPSPESCVFCAMSPAPPKSANPHCSVYSGALALAKYKAQETLIKTYCKNASATDILGNPPPPLPTPTTKASIPATGQGQSMELDSTPPREEVKTSQSVSPSPPSKKQKDTHQKPITDFLTKNKGGGAHYPPAPLSHPTDSPIQAGEDISIGNYSFSLTQVPGDGNCFWHSVKWLSHDSRSISDLKNTTISWIYQNKILFESLCTSLEVPSNEIVSEIRVDKAWTSFATIAIAALALQISILVLSHDPTTIFFTDFFFQQRHLPYISTQAHFLLFHNIQDPKDSCATNFNHYAPISPSAPGIAPAEIWDVVMNPAALMLHIPVEEPPDPSPIRLNTPPTPIPLFKQKSPTLSTTELVPDHGISPPLTTPLPQSFPPKANKMAPNDPSKHNANVISPPTLLQHPKATFPNKDPLAIWTWNATTLRYPGRLKETLDRGLQLSVDLLCLQETQYLDKIPGSCPGFNVEVGIPDFSPQPRGIATLVRSHLLYNRRKDLEKAIGPVESVILEFPSQSGFSTYLANVYFNPAPQLPTNSLTQGISKILEFIQPLDNLVLTGDFNSPGRYFGRAAKPSPRGNALDSYLQSADNLVLASDFKITFIRGDVRSCLDGTLVSPRILHSTLCKQDPFPPGPGHIPFMTFVDVPTIQTKPSPQKKVDSNRIDYTIFFQILNKKTKVLSALPSKPDIQRTLKALSYAAVKACSPTQKTYNSGWWNKRCREAASARNKALRKLQRCKPSSPSFQKKKAKYHKLKSIAYKTFRQAKEDYRAKLIQEVTLASSEKVWKIVSKLIGSRHKRKGTPTTHLSGGQALAKANQLCQEFEKIQKAPDLDSVRIPPSLIKASKSEDSPISLGEIDSAISKLKNSSCPGPDNIPVGVIKRLWSSPKWKPTVLQIINELYQDPSLFDPYKHAIIHPVPKPNQPDAFRPISLLSQFGKVLERVLARRLSDLLHVPNQFGCRPHRSTQDALLRLQHWAVMQDPYGISIFLDISKAYDRVIPELVIHKMHRIPKISLRLIHWVTNFLTNRTFRVRLNGELSEYLAKPKYGLPQGSPLSIPLWHIFFSDVPHDHDDNIYMDDLNYNVSGDSWEELEINAQAKLDKLQRWASANGVIFDARKSKVLPIDPDIDILISLSPGSFSYLPLVQTYKYLGVHLSSSDGISRGFSLKHHFSLLKRNTNFRKRWLLALMDSPLRILKPMYLALVRSLLCYGLILTIRDFSADLEKLQHEILLLICEGHRGTPINRLLHICNLPDILSIAKSTALLIRGKMLAYGGLLAIDYDHWIHHYEGEHNKDSPFGLIQSSSIFPSSQPLYFQNYSPLQPYHIETLSRILLPSYDLRRQNWTPRVQPPCRSVQVFCDGGYNPFLKQGSSGFCLSLYGLQVHSEAHKYDNVFSSLQAETLALRDSLRHLLATTSPHPSRLPIFIFTDSASLIQGLKRWKFSHSLSPLQVEIVNLLAALILSHSLVIRVLWIPGHIGIPGNEQADTLASNALNSASTPLPLDVSLQFFRRQARNLLCPPQEPKLLGRTDSKCLRKLYISPRPIKKSIIRILTNHYNLPGCYYRTLRPKAKGIHKRLRKCTPRVPSHYLCRHCGVAAETVEHLLFQCSSPEVTPAQNKLFSLAGFSPSLLQSETPLHYFLLFPNSWPHVHQFFKSLNISL
jgi:ribonuclease HI